MVFIGLSLFFPSVGAPRVDNGDQQKNQDAALRRDPEVQWPIAHHEVQVPGKPHPAKRHQRPSQQQQTCAQANFLAWGHEDGANGGDEGGMMNRLRVSTPGFFSVEIGLSRPGHLGNTLVHGAVFISRDEVTGLTLIM